MILRSSVALGMPFLLAGCMTMAYMECSLMHKPEAPADKHREFPFVVEFERQGVRGVHRDTQICDYQGVSQGPDCSASHFWRGRLLSGASDVTLISSPELQVRYVTGSCEDRVSTTYHPEMRRDAYVRGADGIKRLLNETELMQKYGIRITAFRVTESDAGRVGGP
jgi:hypothetical protein